MANFRPNQNEYNNMTPFKTWLKYQINTWGLNSFPFVESDFDDLTNYAMMMKLMKHFNVLIENQNMVEEDMTKLYNAFTELQTYLFNEFDDYKNLINGEFQDLTNYVNNFFDNNFPQMINDKLDEMAEDGTLENLLNDSAHLIKVYATYSDMIDDSSTFTNGLRLKTIGYYNVNDGGGSEYFVTNTLLNDEFQIELSNNLYLTLVVNNDNVNILQVGCKGDDSFDNTSILTKLLATKHKSIYIPNGVFKTGVLSINEKNIRGETSSYLKCNVTCDDWITIGNRTTINNIAFNGDNLANTIRIKTTDPSANVVTIKDCIFAFMNKSGLTSEGIDATISGCIFRGNTQHGLRIQEVGNVVENCYSYANNLSGIFSSVGTLMIANCKVYKNKMWGYNIDGPYAHYVTLDGCESQQNGSGSLFLGATTRNCIVNALSSLGESDITTGGVGYRSPVIQNMGSYNTINANITPFHIYTTNEWYGYPTCSLLIGDGINNDINLTIKVLNDEYEQLKELYPTLDYKELRYYDNTGQSNKIIINNINNKNKISVLNTANAYASVRGDIFGERNDNCIFIAKPSFVNTLATETVFTYGEYTTTLDDTTDLKVFQGGIVYPLNYKEHFKACVRIDIVGNVNGNEVQRTGVNSDNIVNNTNENLYKSYIIPYKEYITSQTGYESGSLKIRARIMCQKIDEVTIDEPLILACRDVSLLID